MNIFEEKTEWDFFFCFVLYRCGIKLHRIYSLPLHRRATTNWKKAQEDSKRMDMQNKMYSSSETHRCIRSKNKKKIGEYGLALDTTFLYMKEKMPHIYAHISWITTTKPVDNLQKLHRLFWNIEWRLNCVETILIDGKNDFHSMVTRNGIPSVRYTYTHHGSATNNFFNKFIHYFSASRMSLRLRLLGDEMFTFNFFLSFSPLIGFHSSVRLLFIQKKIGFLFLHKLL